MSKQLLINERPSDNGPSYGGGDFGGGSDWPKASIGNYKGVMLCNRPNELGQQRKPDRSGGDIPFNSRVMPDEPVGWNPTKKLFPKTSKKKIDPNNILIKHRRFLKTLEDQKTKEKEENDKQAQEREEKKKKFVEAAANQRKKIKDMKRDDNGQVIDEVNNDYQEQLPQARLTEENLKKNDTISQKAAEEKRKSSAVQKSQASKKNKQKPAWAKTVQELEDEKEKEIDDLLEFAYELDYEKFMDDFEVRQALAIIKDRVLEIKKDEDWKANIAREWNEAGNDNTGDYQNAYNPSGAKQDRDETRSMGQTSFKSAKTGLSKGSLRSQVEKAVQEQEQNKPEWNGSVKSYNKMSTEERVANRLANEVLRDNAKLRGIHSGQSLQKLLMKEAKKQLMQDDYKGPVIQVIREKELKEPGQDYSNLPYLHKNPAV